MAQSDLTRVSSAVLMVLLVVAVSAMAVLGTEVGYKRAAGYQPEGNGFRPEVPLRPYPAYEPAALPVTGAALGAGFTFESPDVWLSPGQPAVVKGLLHLPENQLPTRVDMLMCFDLSGSMSGELNQVKIQALDIMQQVRSLVPDSRFGVISHVDYPGFYNGCGYGAQYGDPSDGDYPYVLDRPLTSDLTSVHNAINSLSLGDGLDAPECYSRVLYAAYTDVGIGWRGDATKVIVQWGDDVPHDCNFGTCNGLAGTTGPDPGPDGVAGNGDDLDILSVIDGMAGHNITLACMYSGLSMDRLDLWGCLAERTGGQAFDLNPDGTMAGDVSTTEYFAGVVGGQFTGIDYITLEVRDEEYVDWLVDVDPSAYGDVVLDVDQALAFSITLEVPGGTEPGDYCFEICAVGDGKVCARQDVCVHVRPEGRFEMGIGRETGNAGDVVRVPVDIQDATGWGIHLIDIDICWCPDGEEPFSFAGFAPGPVLVENDVEVSTAQTGRNCVNFVGKSDTPLVGGGTLFYIDFTISEGADPCDSCDLFFSSTNLDNSEFIETFPEDGSVCLEHCQIEGFVRNWHCNETREGPALTDPLEDVEMVIYRSCAATDALPSEPLATVQADEDGYYVFDCLAPLSNPWDSPGGSYCEYCVMPGELAIPRGEITAYDASLILQYDNGLTNLSECPFDYAYDTAYPQRVAGDVDCGGTVVESDADLVLQYVVNLIGAFPGCPEWVWVPEMLYTTGCPDALDFIGVLKGDVSGPMPPPVLAPAHIKADTPRHWYEGGTAYVEVPIYISDATDIFSVEFTLDYNASKLALVSIEADGATSGFTVAYNDLGGTVDVAMAGPDALYGSFGIAMVTFQRSGLRTPVANAEVSISKALFNEGDPPAVIDEHTYEGEIIEFSLGPVTPNPFYEGTVITYNATQTASVSLEIFDVQGRIVRRVFDGEVSAGMHEVTWDGCDDWGVRVARGVYFCRMLAEGFSATEKLVLLQ